MRALNTLLLAHGRLRPLARVLGFAFAWTILPRQGRIGLLP